MHIQDVAKQKHTDISSYNNHIQVQSLVMDRKLYIARDLAEAYPKRKHLTKDVYMYMMYMGTQPTTLATIIPE